MGNEVDQVGELSRHPYPRRIVLVRSRQSLWSPSCAAALITKARSYRVSDPARASQWATLAWHAAARLEAGSETRARLVALALAEDGNAQRLLGDWRRAQSRFATARTEIADFEAPRENMEIDLLAGSLAIQREQWRQGRQVLERATAAAERFGDGAALFRAHALRGILSKETGHFVEAIDHFGQAWEAAGEDRCVARMECLHNILATYVDAGWLSQAADLYAAIEPYYRRSGNDALRARGLWLCGRIHVGREEYERAVSVIAEARMMIASGCRYWELAEILVDEALACAGAGDLVRVEELGMMAADAFTAVGLGERAGRVVDLFRAVRTPRDGDDLLALKGIARARDLTPARAEGDRHPLGST